ncbi:MULTISPECIES: PTS sugar transporter subunit IIA [unclassified Enterococcus]|uniref:BglG family transcription antiterminator n=1 Tax=unclassified Enterococcus TaxID=2608891 RepID=UPI0015570D92|nr:MULTISPECIES: PTS sugar transporter subunit IIA [unclassified Enterococcus]MBS7578021.1 PTS sugar transporter subunit IIA [Enterococcus sp. MMGLQ5-2]MBS7585289.1 PTS sugar transporter subunit IIA [Enterococcus sp. MMGLQ5-1]NPD13146.1 PTS transporter subunit EIIA [Enterococcus sp. MMGLQ5-1]NPD37852.1 PTS transporter subunit EIIA [Enterococcus sp. MMGLQ5-2]
MNERIRTILALLIKKPEIKLTELAARLKLTKRQINYAITQFNEELIAKNLPIIERNNNGIFFMPLEVMQLFTNNQSLATDELSAVYSDNERTALILLRLIDGEDYMSMDHFIDDLKVSKTTVMEDLKRTKWLAEKYDLTIQYDRFSGYQLCGSENRVLQLLSDLVKQYLVARKSAIASKLSIATSEEDILQIINSMEQMLHLDYSDESIDYLQVLIGLIVDRALKFPSREPFFEGNIKNTPEYRILKILIPEKGWQLSDDYLEWLSLIFLSSNIFEKKTRQDYDSDAELQALISEMVENFQNQTLIMIDDKENFERRILSHLRPACFRIQYGLSLGIYSFENLAHDSNHTILNDLLKELIIPIENWIGKAFPNDELSLLSYYFGYQLSANSNQLLKQKPKAVVVCRNGVMVSKLMRENLKKLFPEIHFLVSFSARDFYKFGRDYDLVFTTTPLDTAVAQYIVDPIMSYNQQINLRYRVLNDLGINKVDQAADELINIIKQYASIEQYSALKNAIQMFLVSEENDVSFDNFVTLPSLTDYLKPTFIKINQEELDWEKALQIACQPLLANQIVNNDYFVDCMAQMQAKDYSSYLGLDICIPHTTVEHGILKDGVSILISKTPIRLPDGHQVHFIIPLAFFDLTKHLRAINQIADISNDHQFLETLLNTEDEKTIYQLIREFT